MAPWEFAMMDPSAALASMGGGTKIGTGKNMTDLGSEFKQQLQGMAGDEKKQAQASMDALDRIQERQKSGEFLTPQETKFLNTSLDTAFSAAHDLAMQDWTRATQSLAGSRGLRTGDTPVMAPAMLELRNLETAMGGKRAEMGLNATMQMSQQQNLFDQSLMDSLNNLQFNRFQTRMGNMFSGGMQGASSINFTDINSVKNKMSTLGKISASMSVIDQGIDLGAKIGQMAMGLPPMGGGGTKPSPTTVEGSGGWEQVSMPSFLAKRNSPS